MSDTNIDQVLFKGVENATIRDIPNVTCKEGLMKSAIEVTKMITDESDRKNDETNEKKKSEKSEGKNFLETVMDTPEELSVDVFQLEKQMKANKLETDERYSDLKHMIARVNCN